MSNVKRIKTNDMSLNEYLESIHIPKGVINELVSKGLVKENGKVVTFDLEEYDKNDVVPIDYPIDIIYEDSDIIVLKKERGVLIHSDGNTNNTLLNGLAFYLNNKGETLKPRSIHRIDVDTIGLVLFSKNIISYYDLFYQMNEGLIKKKYYAIVLGEVDRGVIDKPIGKDRHKNNHYLVTKSGKKAVTIYKAIWTKDNKSLVDVEIKTGRTHQIRVHMAYIGHAIVGDALYGEGNKLMLENYFLGFINPSTNKYIEIKIDNELEQ